MQLDFYADFSIASDQLWGEGEGEGGDGTIFQRFNRRHPTPPPSMEENQKQAPVNDV